MKRFFSVLILAVITAVFLTAASPLPRPSIKLVQGLPQTMHVGEAYTVMVQVTSDQEFLLAQAMPSFAYPGKGVVAMQGGDRAVRGNSALLELTFVAKSSTVNMANGVAHVLVVTGVRYPGGVVVQEYPFEVTVP